MYLIWSNLSALSNKTTKSLHMIYLTEEDKTSEFKWEIFGAKHNDLRFTSFRFQIFKDILALTLERRRHFCALGANKVEYRVQSNDNTSHAFQK